MVAERLIDGLDELCFEKGIVLRLFLDHCSKFKLNDRYLYEKLCY